MDAVMSLLLWRKQSVKAGVSLYSAVGVKERLKFSTSVFK